ncbi:MAG: hypothetical protein C4K47_04490 [Candidatus Thorarchaeota archaeon]|nr:MAG: hypothetical protein C4K47_04490 [Candidatus Thorarchaeota archaeon]
MRRRTRHTLFFSDFSAAILADGHPLFVLGTTERTHYQDLLYDPLGFYDPRAWSFRRPFHIVYFLHDLLSSSTATTATENKRDDDYEDSKNLVYRWRKALQHLYLPVL